jgi:acetyl-CoA acetyltransferase
MAAPTDALITGLGITEMTRDRSGSGRSLAITACVRALADAGVSRDEVDGLLLCHSPIVPCEEVGISLQHVLGMRDLAVLQDIHAEGSAAGQLIHAAKLYIGAGLAHHVLCVFADAPLSAGTPSGDAYAVAVPHGHLDGWEWSHGLFGAVGPYALLASRHMGLYGTTSEHLGAVAVSARRWAAGNPLAAIRTPLTLEEHHASPLIVDPLRRLDCAFPVNGGIAVLVSSRAAAAGCRRPGVRVAGIGQGHRGKVRHAGDDSEVRTGAGQASGAALEMAGVTLADVDVCETYDCFTSTTIVTLEDFGFCAKGEGGDFVLEGNIDPGGSIPTNTGGGQLSGYYVQGMTPISEAIIQARGDGGERQVAGAEVILVGTQGGILDYHACLVLTREGHRG